MSVADTWKVQMMSGPAYTTPTHVVVRTKAWARCLCVGQNTATLDFFFGLHEYEG